MDLLPEITLAPRVLSNYVAALVHNNIRPDLDKFLQTRHQPANFLHELPSKLRLSAHEASKVFVENCSHGHFMLDTSFYWGNTSGRMRRCFIPLFFHSSLYIMLVYCTVLYWILLPYGSPCFHGILSSFVVRRRFFMFDIEIVL